MEIPNIPELNQSTLDEKKDSERQQRNLSLPDVQPHFNWRNVGQVIFLVLAVVGVVLFFAQHIVGHNLGAYGQATVEPINGRSVSK
jgi:hypothetical protein